MMENSGMPHVVPPGGGMEQHSPMFQSPQVPNMTFSQVISHQDNSETQRRKTCLWDLNDRWVMLHLFFQGYGGGNQGAVYHGNQQPGAAGGVKVNMVQYSAQGQGQQGGAAMMGVMQYHNANQHPTKMVLMLVRASARET